MLGVRFVRPSVDLSVAQVLDDFEDFGECGEWPIVGPLVSVDGHDELELLVGHFALFGSPAVFLTADTRSSPSVEARAALDGDRDVLFPSVGSRAALDGDLHAPSPAIQAGTTVKDAAPSVRIGTSLSSRPARLGNLGIRILLGHV